MRSAEPLSPGQPSVFSPSLKAGAGDSSLAALGEIWRYRPLILELVRRDLKLRYKNSIGGIAWSLLDPLLQIVVITQVMKFLLPNPVKDYSAYLFVLFLWSFFQVSMSDGCVAILHNNMLVRKVYFPRAILPLATLLGNLFHFGIAFVFTILYFFYLGAYPGNLRPAFLLVVPVVACMAALSLGFSFILAYLNVFYEDVRFVVNALLRLFFYAVPILYPIELVKAKGLYNVYMLDPVAALLVTYQRALLLPPHVKQGNGVVLPSVGVPWDYFALAGVLSIITLAVGFLLFEHYKWEMVERL